MCSQRLCQIFYQVIPKAVLEVEELTIEQIDLDVVILRKVSAFKFHVVMWKKLQYGLNWALSLAMGYVIWLNLCQELCGFLEIKNYCYFKWSLVLLERIDSSKLFHKAMPFLFCCFFCFFVLGFFFLENMIQTCSWIWKYNWVLYI